MEQTPCLRREIIEAEINEGGMKLRNFMVFSVFFFNFIFDSEDS